MSGFATHRAGAFVLGLAFAAGLLAQNAHAAMNAYMQIPGIPGESTDSKHRGWIEISSFQWGVGGASTNSYSSTYMRSATSGAGKVSVQDIKITKTVDAASPKLMLAESVGTHFKNVVIEQPASDGRFMVITLQDVLISSVKSAGKGGDIVPMEEVSLNFAKSTTSWSPAATQRVNTIPMLPHQTVMPATQPATSSIPTRY